MPFTFKASYNHCAGPDSYPTTPKCLAGSGDIMPPLPPGDYQVKVDRVPFNGVRKPGALTVHVVAGTP